MWKIALKQQNWIPNFIPHNTSNLCSPKSSSSFMMKNFTSSTSTISKIKEDQVRAIFTAAPFIQDLGLKCEKIGHGFVESSLVIQNKHLQHHGIIHAGVQTTMADHTAGAAASTMLKEENTAVLTAEFKMNLLRAAIGNKLYCRAKVLKAGNQLIVVESEVFVENDERKQDPSVLVAKMTATMSVLKNVSAKL